MKKNINISTLLQWQYLQRVACYCNVLSASHVTRLNVITDGWQSDNRWLEVIIDICQPARNQMQLPYRTKFGRTKFSTDKIFRRTKFSTPSRNFDSFVRFLLDFCIEILDKIFDGQNVSSDKIFDTKLKFRHFCPTNFCPIR